MAAARFCQQEWQTGNRTSRDQLPRPLIEDANHGVNPVTGRAGRERMWLPREARGAARDVNQ